MNYCSVCGKKLDEQNTICGNCSYYGMIFSITDSTCLACGKLNDTTNANCSKCDKPNEQDK
uniref:DZANK-type domain-containing protein n=1 Tax=viral metagenome TaxID=1070528 RepID=A0A6C0C8J1_9ZZZZ